MYPRIDMCIITLEYRYIHINMYPQTSSIPCLREHNRSVHGVYVFTYMHTYIYIHVHTYIPTYTYAYIHANTYASKNAYAYIYANMCVLYLRMHVFIHINNSLYTYTYTYKYIHIYITTIAPAPINILVVTSKKETIKSLYKKTEGRILAVYRLKQCFFHKCSSSFSRQLATRLMIVSLYMYT